MHREEGRSYMAALATYVLVWTLGSHVLIPDLSTLEQYTSIHFPGATHPLSLLR